MMKLLMEPKQKDFYRQGLENLDPTESSSVNKTDFCLVRHKRGQRDSGLLSEYVNSHSLVPSRLVITCGKGRSFQETKLSLK